MGSRVLPKVPDPTGVPEPQHSLAVGGEGGGLLGVSVSICRLSPTVEAPLAVWVEFAWAFNPKSWADAALASLTPTVPGGGDAGE